MKRSILILVLIGILAPRSPVWSATILPINNGFEVPNLGAGPLAFGYGTPIGSPQLPSVAGIGWTFVGASGITANGAFDQSGDSNGNSDGTKSTSGQAAFIQYAPQSFPGLTLSSISQALTFQAGTASVTFSIQRRDVFGNNPIDVKIDNQDLGTYLATNLTGFNTITTPTVAVTAGIHTLYFIGTNPSGAGSSNGDVTQFIDNVSLTNDPATAPEPSSIGLLGTGLIGVLGYSWRRRKSLFGPFAPTLSDNPMRIG
jgi:hypothetical protein